MAPQIDSSNDQVLNANEVDQEVMTLNIKRLQSSEPSGAVNTPKSAEEDKAVVDAATLEEKNNNDEDDDDDSQYNDFVEFVDFLDYLKAPPPETEYVDFLDFIKTSPTNKAKADEAEAEVSVDFLDYLKSPQKQPEEQAASNENASENDDWASLLDEENDNETEEISWSEIIETKALKEDDLAAFIASLASRKQHDNNCANNDPAAAEADFAAFLQFFNSLPTDEKAAAIRTVQENNNNNKESAAETIWSDILTGMQNGVTPGDIPQSWFGYFCEMFTQSLVKVQQPQPAAGEQGKGGEQELAPVATMV